MISMNVSRSAWAFCVLFVLSLSPLLAQNLPIVATAPGSPPSTPAGLQTGCSPGPSSLQAAPCPVVYWNGYTYWAFSYHDNRLSMNIVAFDGNGAIVKQLDRPGARYVWKIEVNETTQIITFFGQAGATVSATFSELFVAPNVSTGINLNSSAVPKDKGASQTLAEFAWQEFVALSWPSVYDQDSPVEGTRGAPNNSGSFKNITGGAAIQPLTVWQTYAHKTEFLTNSGTLPLWSQLGNPDYLYTMPTHVPTPTPVNSLDENSELGLCQVDNNGTPILYEAKVNQTSYEYYLNTNGFYYNTGTASTNNLLTNANRSSATSLAASSDMSPSANLIKYGGTCDTNITGTAADNMTHPIICHPCGGETYNGQVSEGAIETKASWRALNSHDDPSRFYKQEVMVWSEQNGTYTGQTVVYGLVGLHIIHKTKQYPSFTFATFEHVDNYNGLHLVNTAAAVGEAQYVVRRPANSDNFVKDPNRPATIVPSENPTKADFLAQSAEVQAANTWVQNNLPADSVWKFYKLAGIQAVPTSDTTDPNYYLANNVTETNVSLRDFRGPGNTGIKGSQGNGLDVTDNPLNFNLINQANGPGTQFNMGGCQGCHGVAQVRAGADLSFLTGQDEVAEPDTVPGTDVAAMMATMVKRSKTLKKLTTRHKKTK